MKIWRIDHGNTHWYALALEHEMLTDVIEPSSIPLHIRRGYVRDIKANTHAYISLSDGAARFIRRRKRGIAAISHVQEAAKAVLAVKRERQRVTVGHRYKPTRLHG